MNDNCVDMSKEKCCDNCIYYQWYWDFCEKYQCGMDARNMCSEFEGRQRYKGYKDGFEDGKKAITNKEIVEG